VLGCFAACAPAVSPKLELRSSGGDFSFSLYFFAP